MKFDANRGVAMFVHPLSRQTRRGIRVISGSHVTQASMLIIYIYLGV